MNSITNDLSELCRRAKEGGHELEVRQDDGGVSIGDLTHCRQNGDDSFTLSITRVSYQSPNTRWVYPGMSFHFNLTKTELTYLPGRRIQLKSDVAHAGIEYTLQPKVNVTAMVA